MKRPLLFLALCLSTAIPIHAHSESTRSRLSIPGAGIVVALEFAGAEGGQPPDFSRPGPYSFPGSCLFESDLPLIWRDRALSAGEYELAVEVDEEGEIFLTVAPLGWGEPARLPVQIADSSEPLAGLEVHLSSLERDDGWIGVLWIRWGGVILLGEFAPLRQEASEVGRWRLIANSLPPDAEGAEIPLGVLENIRGEGHPFTVYLMKDEDGEPRLRLQNRRYSELLAERAKLRLRINRDRRALRDDPDSAELERELKALNARLDIVTQALRSLEPQGAKILSPRPSESASTPENRLQASLQKSAEGVDLRIAGTFGERSFRLP